MKDEEEDHQEVNNGKIEPNEEEAHNDVFLNQINQEVIDNDPEESGVWQADWNSD